MDLLALRQIDQPLHSSRSVGGVERAVAVEVFRMPWRRAGPATFRISLAEDDGQVAEFRRRMDDSESRSGIFHLLFQPHLHMPVHKMRIALCVERDEVERDRTAGCAAAALRA